jgi:hypothetical protein
MEVYEVWTAATSFRHCHSQTGVDFMRKNRAYFLLPVVGAEYHFTVTSITDDDAPSTPHYINLRTGNELV